MSRIAYVNGRYVPHSEASVHIEDRGYQFADGVYEVVLVHRGKLVDEIPHLDRLDRSLSELQIDAPMPRAPLRQVMREMVRRNRISDGIVYIQATRGVARRDHPFPKNTRPALVMTSRRLAMPDRAKAEEGVAALTIPDIRWARCDIKAVALLPNVLGKQQAREAGAYEAWQVDDEGYVTEGTSTNTWIVTPDGELVTRQIGEQILSGITRATLIDLAAKQGVTFVERRFTVAEALGAREAFVTSATSFVTPITKINDTVIGNGRAGSVAMGILDSYLDYAADAGAS
ncbi:MAG: D-amino-acid transaminase [Alphaproteobacteria bacterium]|jgi:D-alanine transaminase|nr:D-amino-acid transaminase [Alphaproteobacteria bacterium]